MAFMLALLSLVVSLDGFTAAISYGARRIRLSPLAVIIVSLTSGLSIYLAMTLGLGLGGLMNPALRRYLGSGLLMSLGGYVLWQQHRGITSERCQAVARVQRREPIARINLRALGLVIEILHDPTAADRDQSGVISWQESFALGAALALDALGAGIGAALTGLPAAATALTVGLAKVAALLLGWEAGYRFAAQLARYRLGFLPGLMLFCLGLFSLL
jgi:putative sporulation protein YtaF